MNLEELNLVNFRNLNNQTIKFKKGVSVFWGDNAAGKTNLLEAIYLLASGKSFRTRESHELITWGENQARVRGKAGSLDIELTVKPVSKELTINSQPRKLTDLIGSFIAVLFTPADVGLVSGAPSERRRYLDQLLSYLSREYLLELVNLNRVLKSRNHTLYRLAFNKNDSLEVWDEQLAKIASFIWEERVKVVAKINQELKSVSKKLLQAEMKIEYTPLFGEDGRAKIRERYLKRLEEVRAEELQKKVTLFGPHRDNFKIILEETKEEKIISKDLGIYGSRGEQRSAALALKLVELTLLETEREVQPALLLDEVLSELDQNHRELLLRQVYNRQTFITSTNLESVEEVLGKKVTGFHVENGTNLVQG